MKKEDTEAAISENQEASFSAMVWAEDDIHENSENEEVRVSLWLRLIVTGHRGRSTWS